jgi:hypothetical protein
MMLLVSDAGAGKELSRLADQAIQASPFPEHRAKCFQRVSALLAQFDVLSLLPRVQKRAPDGIHKEKLIPLFKKAHGMKEKALQEALAPLCPLHPWWGRAFAAEIIQASADNCTAEQRKQSPPPPTENEKEVLGLIEQASRDGGAIDGKGIRKATGIEQSTLTKHIIPRLKKYYGVENRRGAGYFIAH